MPSTTTTTTGNQELISKYKLGQHRYGKSFVRVVKVNKYSDRHEMVELNVQILLEGDQFADSYYTGDNAMVVPTDTVKNTVFILAKHHKCQPIEDFALLGAKHFLTTYSHVNGVKIQVEETVWERLIVENKPHHHAFQRKQNHVRFCSLSASNKGAELELESGIKDLLVAKTTKSGFTGYHKCKYTTLQETTDRIVRTNVYATWKYTQSVLDQAKRWLRDGRPALQAPQKPLSSTNNTYFIVDFNSIFKNTQRILIENFAGDPVKGNYSESVQQTLYEMGGFVLEAEPNVESIFISLPNLHCFVFDLKRFNLENDNEVFFPQEDPFGLIQAEIVRSSCNRGSHPEKNGPRFAVNSRL